MNDGIPENGKSGKAKKSRVDDIPEQQKRTKAKKPNVTNAKDAATDIVTRWYSMYEMIARIITLCGDRENFIKMSTSSKTLRIFVLNYLRD